MNRKAIGVFGYLLLLIPATLNLLAMSYYLFKNFFSVLLFAVAPVQTAYGTVGFGGFYEIYLMDVLLVFWASNFLTRILKNDFT